MPDDLRRLAIGIALVVTLVAGLLFWNRAPLSTNSESAPTTPVPFALLSPPAQAPPPAASAPKPQPARTLAAPTAQPIAAIARPQAAPPALARIEFPANLPSAFTAAGFHDALQRTIAACSFPLEITEEDCSEFPCIAWGKWTADSFSRPSNCAAWRDTYGDVDFGTFHVDPNDDIPRVGISALPPGYSFTGVTMKHLRARTNDMLRAQGGKGLDDEDEGGSNAPEKRTPERRLAKGN